MKVYFIGLVLLAIVLSPFGFAQSSYAVIDIDKMGFEALENLKKVDSIEWWVELDNQLLVLCSGKVKTERKIKKLSTKVKPELLYFVFRAHQNNFVNISADVLIQGARYAVIQSHSEERPVLCHPTHPGFSPDVHAKLVSFSPNTVLARQGTNQPALASSLQSDPRVQRLVDQVDGKRWFATVEKLASYNRYSYGSEILEARDWLVSEYKKLPGMEVSLMPFDLGGSTAYNVVAVLKGSKRADEWFIIGGHYDSTSQNPLSSAPGAEDNASGAAGVLEMARIYAQNPPEATLIFMSFSGEEQGLHGSRHHVKELTKAGHKSRVKGVITMDMIGYTRDSLLDCLLETGRGNQKLLDIFSQAAKQYTSLKILTSFNPFGSDHVPYINAGIPALLVIENDWNRYPNYHRTSDTPQKINLEMGTHTLRMNVAALAEMVRQR